MSLAFVSFLMKAYIYAHLQTFELTQFQRQLREKMKMFQIKIKNKSFSESSFNRVNQQSTCMCAPDALNTQGLEWQFLRVG